MKTETKILPMNHIRIGDNHRSNEVEDLSGMMASIKTIGLLEPIGVAKDKISGYRVIYGFRRYHAVNKLGLKEITCVIHDDLSSAQEQLINLAENVQRKNPTLMEIGRWANQMRVDGSMTLGEIAARMGVSKSYVDGCISAYFGVPAEYRDRIEKRASGRGVTALGTISVRQATAIQSVSKVVKLTEEQKAKLFETASQHGTGFQVEQVRNYALNIADGKDAFAGIRKLKSIPKVGLCTQDEYDRIRSKYIEGDQPTAVFKTMHHVIKAILRGEISEKIDVL